MDHGVLAAVSQHSLAVRVLTAACGTMGGTRNLASVAHARRPREQLLSGRFLGPVHRYRAEGSADAQCLAS